jgi:hypothetical protein
MRNMFFANHKKTADRQPLARRRFRRRTLLRVQLLPDPPKFHEAQGRRGAKNGTKHDEHFYIHERGLPPRFRRHSDL